MQNFLGSLRSPTLLYWYFQTVVNLKLFNDFLYIFPYLPNNIYTCRHQCINWTPSFHISSLWNYAYINVIYPSYCDTTVDLYMQAHELMKSSKIAGFCTNFCRISWRGPPRPPFKYTFRLSTSNTAIYLTFQS